jgi:hypothetical protein
MQYKVSLSFFLYGITNTWYFALAILSPRQIQVCLTKLYFHIAQKSRFSDSPINYRYPALSANAAKTEVAEFLCSYRRVFVPLLKSRFFGFYVNGVTLADGIRKASLV